MRPLSSYHAECAKGTNSLQRNEAVRTVSLHDSQELNDDLRARSDEDLSLAGLLGIVERIKSVVENGSLDHCGGIARFSDRSCWK